MAEAVQKSEENQIDDPQVSQKTVGEMVDAGEAVIPPSPKETDADGRLRITLAPVITTPRPEAETKEISRLEGVDKPPFVRTTDVSEQIQTDIAAQKPVSLDSILADMKAGKDVKIGERTISGSRGPVAAKIIEGSPKQRLLIEREILAVQKAMATEEPRAAFTDFVTGQAAIPESMTDPADVSTAENYANTRLAINALLKPIVNTGDERMDVAVRQIFVDHFSTDWHVQLAQRIADQSRGLVTLPNIAMFYGANAAEAVGGAILSGRGVAEEWRSRSSERERRYNRLMGLIDEVLPGPTLAMHFNNEVRRIAGEYRDDGLMSEEDYQSLVFETVGDEKVERQFVDEDTAYKLMDMSYNQLGELGQAGLFLSENLLTGGVFVGSKSMQGKQYIDELKKQGIRLNAPETVLDSPMALRNWIANNHKSVKLNDKLLKVGVDLEETKTNFIALKDRAVELDGVVAKLVADGKTDTTEYAMAVSNRDNAYRRISRSRLALTTRPYLKEGAVDAAIISLGQYGAVEMLTPIFGDQGLAEAAGFGAMAFGGRYLVTNVTKFGVNTALSAGGFLGRQGMRVPKVWDFTRFLGERINRNLPLTDTTIDDYELNVWRNIPGNEGKRMSMQERGVLKQAIDAANNLDPEAREMFGQDIAAINDLTDKIVSVFPEGPERIEAERLFNISVGEMLNVNQLNAATAAINLRSFTPTTESMNQLVSIYKAKYDRTNALKMGLDALEKYVMQNPNASSSAPIRAMLENMRGTVEKLEVKNLEDNNVLLNSMDTFIELASANALESTIETDFVNSMVEFGVDLRATMGEIVDENEVVKQVNAAWARGTSRRFDQVESLRANAAAHRTQLTLSLEQLALDQLDLITATGDAAYDGVRRYVQRTDRKDLDISPAVEKLISIVGEGTPIERVFGPDGLLFDSPVGRKSQRAFDAIVDRKLAELSSDAREGIEAGILEFMTKNDASEADVKFMAKELAKMRRTAAGRIEFALMAHETEQLNIFDGIRLDEVDVLRRAFRDYGYRVRKSNPAVSGRFTEFAKFLDDVIKTQDEEGFRILEEARVKYADSVGDATREGGTLAFVNDQRKGGERVSEAEGGTRFFYTGGGPRKMFDDISVPMLNLIRKSGQVRADELQGDLQAAVTDMVYAFGQRLPGGKKGYDLRTPDGREKFMIANKAIRETVYEGWWRDFRAAADRRVGAKVQPEATYDFERSEFVENINNNMLVDVILEDGTAKTIPLFDLGQLYRFEDMMIDNLEKGTKLYDASQDYIRRLKARAQEVRGEVKVQDLRKQQARKTIQALADIDNPSQFFDKYIGGYGHDVNDLRTAYISAAVSLVSPDQAKKAAQTAAEEFDSGVQSLTFQALLEKGGYGMSPDATFTSVKDGERFAGKILNDTVGLMETLKDENVQQRLLQVMDADSIEYMFNIVAYTHMKNVTGARMIHGRPMSANEVISRAYNIARGMVSPLYVGTEIGVRIAQEANANILILAMENRDAGRIMSTMLTNPKALTPQDLSNFDEMVLAFIATQGQEQVLTKFIDVEEEPTNEDE